jgi:membrane-associated protein
MEFIRKAIDLVLHLDKHLVELVAQFGPWMYLILFLIIFCETGLVVTPFLPGDSLLFAIGGVCALAKLNVWAILGLLTAAAISGDNVNYWIGYHLGPKVFKKESRLLNKRHLERTHDFYDRYGGKTIIIARFVPIIRTFAPFVAGIGRMRYLKFISFSIGGGVLWIFSMTLAGYFFGNLAFVKKNFSIVILMIIFISILPAIIEFMRERKRQQRSASEGK